MPLKVDLVRMTSRPDLEVQLTPGDTNRHLLELTQYFRHEIYAVVYAYKRVAGAGTLKVYPMSATIAIERNPTAYEEVNVLLVRNSSLDYAMSDASGDYKILLMGAILKES